MRRPSHVTVKLIGFLVALVLILPTLVVIPMSFTGKASFVFPPESWSLRWYREFFEDPAWYGSLQRSLLIAVVSAAVATVAGTTAALGLVKWTRARAVVGIRAILLSPIVVPGIVLAIGVYTAFLKLGIVGTTGAFILAHAALGLPYVLVSVSATLASVDPNLERAAVILGATRWSVIRSVTLPLVMPGVLGGALFAFVTSFDEILVSLFIKSPFLETLPVRMYVSVVSDTDPTIAAASTIVLAITTAVLLLGAWGVSGRLRLMKGKAAR
jgi:putative spermidine/putrescine transport system permease protein